MVLAMFITDLCASRVFTNHEGHEIRGISEIFFLIKMSLSEDGKGLRPLLVILVFCFSIIKHQNELFVCKLTLRKATMILYLHRFLVWLQSMIVMNTVIR